MADFCMQCDDGLAGLEGITTPEDEANGLYALVICEGCGPILVDSKGNCVSEDCLQNGHKN